MIISALNRQEVLQLIPGPSGELECAIAATIDPTGTHWGVICHPHPLFSGTMHNKVVTTIAKTYQQLGINTIRFNYRGVGQSSGNYGEGQGEIEDLMAVIAWIKAHYPLQKLYLAGFSFGGYIAASGALRTSCEQLILIAPAVTHFPMQTLPEFQQPTLVIQGEQDEVVPASEVYAWVESRKNKPELVKIPQATHFFHGLLGELQKIIAERVKVGF